MERLILESENKFSIDENGIIKNILSGRIMKSKLAQFPLSNGKKKCMTRNSLHRIYFTNDGAQNGRKNRSLIDRVILSRLYYIIHRCYDIKDKQYKYYGAKGITVFEDWINDKELFLKYCLDNDFKKELTIDRIDNNIGYYPGNIRFVNSLTQNNNMSSNIILYHNGIKYTLSQFCREYGLNYKSSYGKYYKNKNDINISYKLLKKQKLGKTIFLFGEETTLKEVSIIYNIPHQIIKSRDKRGDKNDRLIRKYSPKS